MKQILVVPRLVGWSGDWDLRRSPDNPAASGFSVSYALGAEDALDFHPYGRTVVATFNGDDEERFFVFRGGKLVALNGPDGMPEWLERAEEAEG